MKPRSKHKGVGTLIAAVFIILIVVSAFATFMILTRQMQQYQRIIEEATEVEHRKQSESFEITDVTCNSSGLFVYVENTGSLPVVITYIGLYILTS